MRIMAEISYAEPGMGNGYSQPRPDVGFPETDSDYASRIFREYGARLYRTGLGILRNHQDAEDVVQETMLKACLNRNTFREECPEYPWLHQIATNSALDLLRGKEGSWRKYAEDADCEGIAFDPVPQLYEKDQLRVLVGGALRRLDPKKRGTLMAYCSGDKGSRMLAVQEKQKVGLNTAKAHVDRARRKFLDCLCAEARKCGIPPETIPVAYKGKTTGFTAQEVSRLLRNRIVDGSLAKLNELFERGLKGMQFYIHPARLVANAKNIERKLWDLDPLEFSDETGASIAAIMLVYNNRKYYGNPLHFFQKHRRIFGNMSRGDLKAGYGGLYRALRKSAQLGEAIPQTHELTDEKRANITKALVQNNGLIAETAGQMGCSPATVKKCGLAARIRMRRKIKKLDESQVQEIRDAVRTYGTAYAAAKHLPHYGYGTVYLHGHGTGHHLAEEPQPAAPGKRKNLSHSRPMRNRLLHIAICLRHTRKNRIKNLRKDPKKARQKIVFLWHFWRRRHF